MSVLLQANSWRHFSKGFQRAADSGPMLQTTHSPCAEKRLKRFGERVDYRVGCPGRDVSDGAVPADVDVLASS